MLFLFSFAQYESDRKIAYVGMCGHKYIFPSSIIQKFWLATCQKIFFKKTDFMLKFYKEIISLPICCVWYSNDSSSFLPLTPFLPVSSVSS